MTTTTAHRSARTFRPRPSVRGMFRFLADADARYRAREQLRMLDDHLLRDIGVSRGDRDEEIRRSFLR